MKIFRTDTKEVVGRVIYLNRGAGIRLFSGCLYQPYAAFKCTPDMGTNAKVLLIGTLFFLVRLCAKYFNLTEQLKMFVTL